MTSTTVTPDRKEIECPVCKKTALEIPFERLPGGGTINIAKHNDGTYHRYEKVQYSGDKDKKSAKELTVFCPKCKEKGTLKTRNDWLPSMGAENQHIRFHYVVRHPDKGKHRVEHSSVKQDFRDDILKQVERYIETPPDVAPKKKRGWPKGRPRKKAIIPSQPQLLPTIKQQIKPEPYPEIVKLLDVVILSNELEIRQRVGQVIREMLHLC